MTWWAVPFIAAHRVVLTLVANLHAGVIAVIHLKVTCVWRSRRPGLGELALHLLLHLRAEASLLWQTLPAWELLARHGTELRVVEVAVGEW